MMIGYSVRRLEVDLWRNVGVRGLTHFTTISSASVQPSAEHRSFSGLFAACAVLLGGTVSFADGRNPSPAIGAASIGSNSPPNAYVAPREIKGHLPQQVTLYQYEVCPYCCKVKAALDFYQVPYKVIEVNPLTKSELKSWSSYKKVPVVKLDDGEVVADSSAIISRLAAEAKAQEKSKELVQAAPVATAPPASAPKRSWFGFGSPSSSSSSSGTPSTPAVQQLSTSAVVGDEEEEERWRRWVDDKFVKVLTANIYRNWNEAWESFRYITDHTKWAWGTREAARVSGAVLMWQIGKKLPKKYSIEGDVREALYVLCDEFVDAVGDKRLFMGGSDPNLADLAVYGVLKAVNKTPTFEDVMRNTRIEPWYKRMEARLPSARIEE